MLLMRQNLLARRVERILIYIVLNYLSVASFLFIRRVIGAVVRALGSHPLVRPDSNPKICAICEWSLLFIEPLVSRSVPLVIRSVSQSVSRSVSQSFSL